MRLRMWPGLGVALATLTACSDAVVQPVAGLVERAAAPHVGTVASTDLVFRGASYGPNGEEVYPSNCSPTYTFSKDSVNISKIPGEKWWVFEEKNKRSGCVLRSTNVGVNILGGDIVVSVIADGVAAGDVLEADNEEELTLSNVPQAGTVSLWAEAAPRSGYAFLYWTIIRANGTSYRDYNAQLSRSGPFDDVWFFAEFKASSGGGGGSGGGDPPPDTCDDPTAPGCDG